MRMLWFWFVCAVAGALFVWACQSAPTSTVGATIKTVADLGTALCEITMQEHPELVPPGQVLDTVCHDVAFVQPFIDEISGAKQRRLLRMYEPRESKPVVDSEKPVPLKD